MRCWDFSRTRRRRWPYLAARLTPRLELIGIRLCRDAMRDLLQDSVEGGLGFKP